MLLHDVQLILHKKGKETAYFEAANQDLTDATYQYYGFVNLEGRWIVMRFQIISSAIIYTYAAGQNIATYNALWNGSGIYGGSLTFYTFDTFLSHLQ